MVRAVSTKKGTVYLVKGDLVLLSNGWRGVITGFLSDCPVMYCQAADMRHIGHASKHGGGNGKEKGHWVLNGMSPYGLEKEIEIESIRKPFKIRF